MYNTEKLDMGQTSVCLLPGTGTISTGLQLTRQEKQILVIVGYIQHTTYTVTHNHSTSTNTNKNSNWVKTLNLMKL